MSSMYDSRVVYPPEFDEVDLSKCETCKHTNYDFECGDIGYCITSCGENYVIVSLLQEKGYVKQINTDSFPKNGKVFFGIEMYKSEAKIFMENMTRLGHTCTTHNYPIGKNYLTTVLIDGGVNPIELCGEILKLDVIS